MSNTKPIALYMLTMLAVACTGGGNFGSDNQTLGALDANEQALTSLQNRVINARGNRCGAAQDAMRSFQAIISRNSRLNPEIVEIVRTAVTSLVTTYCQAGGDAGVVDSGRPTAPPATTTPPPATTPPASTGSGQLVMCGSASCGPCRSTRALLDSLGVTYTYHDLSTQTGIDACYAAVRAKGSSEVTMPTILNTACGQVINGYSEQRIRGLVSSCSGGSSTTPPASTTQPPASTTPPATTPPASTSSQIVVYGREATCGRCRAAALQLTQANVTFTRCDFADQSCVSTASRMINSSSIGMPVISYKGHLIYPYSNSALASAIQQYGR